MPATKVRAMAGALEALRGLRREKDQMAQAEVLEGLIRIRGMDGAIVDLIDGLRLVAERDDVLDQDYKALSAELDALHEWACGAC